LQTIELLSWLALPVGLIVIVDDWFLRSRRQIAASPAPPADPTLMKTLYMLLPLLILAAVVRLLLAERLDFSAVLFGITAITGVAWLLDVAILRRGRTRAARAAGKDPALIPEPARSTMPAASFRWRWSSSCCGPSFSSRSGSLRIP